MTFALGWALHESPTLLQVFLRSCGIDLTDEETVIRLQEHEDEGGYTDIEVESPGRFFVLIEAKSGWALPAADQLKKYRHRPAFVRSQAPIKAILVVSECSSDYALANLPFTALDGVPICLLSWATIAESARRAYSQTGGFHEKALLNSLVTYLGGLVSMQTFDSNWTYVVSLGSGTNPGWKISWIDVVVKRGRYFHPMGKRWPKEPPNYVGFRYWGKLQSIHHIESYEVITDLHDCFAEIPSKNEDPHFLYHLGPAFAPDHPVPTGNLYRAQRVWCLLDTLFTAPTIRAARDETHRRELLARATVQPEEPPANGSKTLESVQPHD